MSKYFSFYKQYFDRLKNKDGEVQVSCPFHGKDKNPSMSINMTTGMYNCFTCGEAGDAYTFYRKKHNCNFPTAKKAVEKETGEWVDEEISQKKQPIKVNIRPEKEYQELAKQVEAWHETLMKSGKKKKWLETKRGISEETLKKFQLGWDFERITIPIKDKEGRIVNVRRYKPGATGKEPKMMSFKRGQGSARLFPITSLGADTILICEGEMDAIIANQLGFDAITVTGGAGTWKEEWNPLFKGKSVYICYDVDAPGASGARKVAQNLFRIADATKIVLLPLEEKGSDITDYFHGNGQGKKDFKGLMARSPDYKQTEKEKEKDFPYDVHLSVAERDEYEGKMLTINVIVAGKGEAAFKIPAKVKYWCDRPGDKKCMMCSLRDDGEKIQEFNAQDPVVLEMINTPKDRMWDVIRKKAAVLKGCGNADREADAYMNIEMVHLIPEIDAGETEQNYVRAMGYYVGHGLIANQSYTLIALATVEPKTQLSTILIEKADLAQDSVMAFELTPEIKKELEVFQCAANDESIAKKLKEIHDDLTDNVTQIYGRNDLLMAIDLVIHSALGFDFQGKRLKRGWCECMLLGDTRTGKTEAVQSLMGHYRVGELVTGESSSKAGLTGGMIQTSNGWLISWGKIPLNDRRLVAIDEVTGLSQEKISEMSGIRSSGVAEITKVQTAKTHARTRLIWISNPRDARPLSEYSFGVEAISGIIGKPEDISRFDFAISCATEEVDPDVINQGEHDKKEHIYTADLCNKLVLWTWSRKTEQIVFEPKAIKAILGHAKLMGKNFSSMIPLVEGADQRIKIARLSVSMAARLFSADETGEKIIVKAAHVDKVIEFLYEIYNKGSLGYSHYSDTKLANKRKVEERLTKIKEFLADKETLRELFYNTRHVRIKDMTIWLDEDKQVCEGWARFMLLNGLIRQTTNGYEKTAEFIKILRGVM